ncbi:bidirectional sugar transporter SWEET17 [Senna tora]|uniref:Bidirectional sugar transporter SWEET n=1 Tax=Senna tora TaxID=362788 RepID=A0A834WXX3_9FABA|nr:bidirectional sugar transporter SWEET17 [Senna tora]
MAELSFFVGVIGNIISVLMFLSPVPTFWRIIKQRSTEDFESLPYICTLLNSSLWTYYGIIKAGEYLVATVNGFGVAVEIAYVKTAIVGGILDVGFFAAAVIATQLALKGEARSSAVGIMGAALNIVMYASPLSAMKAVVTTRSVEYMPFLLSLFMFLNGAVWLFYAILVRDYILGVPNGTGLLLGAVQLVLYGIYRNAKSCNKSKQHQSQQEPLISSTTQSHVLTDQDVV